MTYLSDTLTVGLVLVLLFGSIALYLYTRIQQSEQKISLLESILLDLKMSSEVRSYSELPAVEEQSSAPVPESRPASYEPFKEDDEEVSSLPLSSEPSTNVLGDSSITLTVLEEEPNEVEEYKNVVADVVNHESSSESKLTNYENMTLKELQSLAKSRGITGASTMKKGSLVEALKTSDRSSAVKPGSLSSSSFLESSASVSDEHLE
jgi:hypothetical protein